MNKKSLVLAILLVFVIVLSTSVVSAEEITEDAQLKETDNIAITQTDENIVSSQQTVTAGSDSATIQEKINSLNDGDTLNFEAGEYKDICIYVNKSITINGNGAKLIGYDNPSQNNTPEIIWKDTAEGGYAIGNLATLYVVKATGVTINGLTIIGGENSTNAYSNALVYAMNANNLTFKNNVLDGSSWGLYFQLCADGIVKENTIKNQAVTGFLNFGSARTTIENNKVINAVNHGIDVRHGSGPNVKVINNTVIGSKEGIYLMHSKGHTAANNTLINCTISSISCYGSSNINIKGNKMQKSRIGLLLGGGYANITVGENTFALDNLPYPPTFVYYVAESKSDYQSPEDIMGTHSDSSTNSPNYVAYTGIDAPKDIQIDYDTILAKTGTEWTVPEGTSSADIQKMIDGMNDGDSLSFTKNAVYENISIYTDKNIKIFGNNA
ncbi:nitrous oxide reductase family maturation protein NosD, partial [uncultured Methanobrevibacter sp.]|uniref:right-handed parallel beta-helix repeat-containing protein n=1 Tax=uncultured Methanobrevibacter sp. TaxID=253161 RepID=UPI0025E42722